MDKIELWSEQEIQSGNRACGTFQSCKPSLTWYPAANGQKRGTIIVCPGGGYVDKAPHEGEPVALKLNEAGINAYVLDYRVSPDMHPAPLFDAGRAITTARRLAESLGTRADRIGILGFSAGGHLAASAATIWDKAESRPDACVLCYPVITFERFAHASSRHALLGDDQSETRISDLSIENRVNKHTPPVFIWHTADDEAVPVENTLLMASALSSKQVPFSCHIYPHGQHGLGLAEAHPEIATWMAHCVAFLTDLEF